MIIVCPLSAVQGLVNKHRVGHVISLLGPDTAHRAFSGIAQERHLKLTFHDIIAPLEGFTPPQPEDAARLVSFILDWDRDAPMLIHCWAGISRSTAAAFTAMCILNPHRDEREIAQELRSAAPSATPNRLIVSHTDTILGRNGRMVAAVEAIGRGQDAFEGTPFLLRP